MVDAVGLFFPGQDLGSPGDDGFIVSSPQLLVTTYPLPLFDWRNSSSSYRSRLSIIYLQYSLLTVWAVLFTFSQAHIMRVAEVFRVALLSEDTIKAIVKCHLVGGTTFAHFLVLSKF
jgi:hypothetical protein